ncbi:MAG: NUDIX domain-containing protein [Bacteroidia bacterium]|nr:NUDIX domain-containing protein [Bacteroidia bacterium]
MKIYVNNIPIQTNANLDSFNNTNVLEWVKSIEEGGISTPVFTKMDYSKVIDIILEESKLIEAAGGIVFNPHREFLLMFRRGFWDLPKGKIDKGEKPEQAALREVWEECGLTDLKINRAIAPSYHTYWMKGKRILKLSHWFEMKIPDFQIPTLQTEEDIEDAVWIPISGFQPYRPISYPSIVDVVDSFNS